MSYAYRVGHDAEFFVSDNSGNIVPVCEKVGGTKSKPLDLEGSCYGTTIQEDGVALELGMSPVHPLEFSGIAYHSVLEASAWLLKKGLSVQHAISSHEFAPELLSKYPQANEIGCMPDRNAWERGQKRMPILIGDLGNNRFTGGHLHFSYECEGTGVSHKAKNGTPTWAIVQMLDALALSFWAYYDAKLQSKRAAFYGLPGLYRNKPYGLEYRTPTNHSVIGNESYVNDFIIRCSTVVQACAELSAHKVREFYDTIPWPDVARMLDLSQLSSREQRRVGSAETYSTVANVYQDLSNALGGLRDE